MQRNRRDGVFFISATHLSELHLFCRSADVCEDLPRYQLACYAAETARNIVFDDGRAESRKPKPHGNRFGSNNGDNWDQLADWPKDSGLKSSSMETPSFGWTQAQNSLSPVRSASIKRTTCETLANPGRLNTIDQPGSRSRSGALRAGQAQFLMPALSKLNYYRRVFRAYLSRPGQLNFWHDAARVEFRAPVNSLGRYFMGDFTLRKPVSGPAIPVDSAAQLSGSIGLRYTPSPLRNGEAQLQPLPKTRTSRIRPPVHSPVTGLQSPQPMVTAFHTGTITLIGIIVKLSAPGTQRWRKARISLLVRAHAETECQVQGPAHARSFLSTASGGVTFKDTEEQCLV